MGSSESSTSCFRLLEAHLRREATSPSSATLSSESRGPSSGPYVLLLMRGFFRADEPSGCPSRWLKLVPVLTVFRFLMKLVCERVGGKGVTGRMDVTGATGATVVPGFGATVR